MRRGHGRGSGQLRQLVGALALLAALFIGAGAGSVVGRSADPLVELSPLMFKDGTLSEILEAGSGPGVDPGERVVRADGIVLIWGETLQGPGAGTGMIITPSGLVLTNYHVVADTSELTIQIIGERAQHTAKVLGFDEVHDVALLQMDEKNREYATVKIAERAAAMGDPIAAIGNGSGFGYLSVVAGRVTGLDISIDVTDPISPNEYIEMTGLIRTDADVVPGYSGGPMINERGEVVGITSASSFATSDINGFAVPIREALDIAGKINGGIASKDIVVGRKAALGITYGIDGGQIRVQDVHSGSAAEKIGLLEGDIILSVDGVKVSGIHDLSDLISGKHLGDTVTITWTDETGEIREETATLGESQFN